MGFEINPVTTQDFSELPPSDTRRSPSDEKMNLLSMREFVNLALTFEKAQTNNVSGLEKKSQSILDLIESVQKLSRLLPHEGEEVKNEQEIRAQLQTLKEKGLSLIEDEKKPLTKASISQIKTMISSYQEQYRTQLQQNFTKMQTIVQNMQSIYDTVKRMIDQSSELYRKILENGRKH